MRIPSFLFSIIILSLLIQILSLVEVFNCVLKIVRVIPHSLFAQ